MPVNSVGSAIRATASIAAVARIFCSQPGPAIVHRFLFQEGHIPLTPRRSETTAYLHHRLGNDKYFLQF